MDVIVAKEPLAEVVLEVLVSISTVDSVSGSAVVSVSGSAVVLEKVISSELDVAIDGEKEESISDIHAVACIRSEDELDEETDEGVPLVVWICSREEEEEEEDVGGAGTGVDTEEICGEEEPPPPLRGSPHSMDPSCPLPGLDSTIW